MLVIIESPFTGDIERNRKYLHAAMRDSLLRGEAPFASHAIYTLPGVLNDDIPEERQLGIKAGFQWHLKADKVVVYCDLGVSYGMREGIVNAQRLGIDIETRSISGWEK